MQVQVPSKLNNRQETVVLGTDVSVNCGRQYIPNCMHSRVLCHSVEAMDCALTYVTDHSNKSVLPSVQHGNHLSHSMCLCAMGLHTYLSKNHKSTGSPESLYFTNITFLLLNYTTLKASNKIAKERGESFHNL